MENNAAQVKKATQADYIRLVIDAVDLVRNGSEFSESPITADAVDDVIDGFTALVPTHSHEFFIDLLKYAGPEASSRFVGRLNGCMTCGMIEWEKVAAYVVAGDVIARLRQMGIAVEAEEE